MTSARRPRSGSRALIGVLIAVAAHVLVIAALILWAPDFLDIASGRTLAQLATPLDTHGADERPLEIESLVNEVARPDVKSAAEKQREEVEKKAEADKSKLGQVVDIAKPVVEERPDEAKYSAEYNSKVERETKAKPGRQPGAVAGPSEDVPGAQAARPQPPAPKAGERDAHEGPTGLPEVAMRERTPARAPGEAGPKGPSETAPPARDDDGPTRPLEPGHANGENGAPAVPQQKATAPAAPPGAVGPMGLPGEGGAKALRPNEEALQRAIAKGAGSLDYLHDMDDGDETALNAKKNKFATFFNRVKRAVAEEWHPDNVYIRHDPSGNIYGVKDRITVLRVHLRPDGTLASWNVLQSSGADFLDDEAIESFKRCKHFPNPPKELVDEDGQVNFTFGFVFELSGRPSFKVYKYN